MTSAPSVNQIRFLSSVALEKAPKLILEASCSAADAIWDLPGWTYLSGLRLGSAASAAAPPWRRPSSILTSTLPPAFSTAAIAALEAPATLIVSLAFELALGEQAHAVARAAQHAGRDQGRAVDRAAGRELAGVDRLLQAAEIDLDDSRAGGRC